MNMTSVCVHFLHFVKITSATDQCSFWKPSKLINVLSMENDQFLHVKNLALSTDILRVLGLFILRLLKDAVTTEEV
jgi:hypothetical protein